MHTGEVKTLLVPPPPPKARRRTRSFEYQESEVERDLSDHVERALSGGCDFPTQPLTQMEAQDLTKRLRRIYLRIFGKGGMII